MPELPEVTTVIGILKNEIIGKTIDNIEILYRNIIESDINSFENDLKNRTFLDITRMGKYIIFHLDNEKVIISHLRMEGKYSLLSKEDTLPSHSCVIFNFKDNTRLVYHDTRKFGVLILSDEQNYLSEKCIAKLGPEPMVLRDKTLRKPIYKKLNTNKKIKELLLDQTIMAGIGNIYADEILFVSKINPLTKGNELTQKQYDLLIDQSIVILERAIELGGSTIKSYHPKDGVDGLFQIELKAYGKVGENCPNCGTPFKKISVGGRGTTYCPNCQVDHSIKKAIGITGSIGAGKSTVLQVFKELGYFVASSDEIVANLYTKDEIKHILVKKFGFEVLDENNNVNKVFLRQKVSNNEVLQRFLENLVFPLVEKEIINIIKTYENPVIEVPLLAKAHMEYLFKKIIFVDANKSIREKRISMSRPYNAKQAIALYEKNNPKTPQNSVIFKNNFENIEELKNEIETNLINKL